MKLLMSIILIMLIILIWLTVKIHPDTDWTPIVFIFVWILTGIIGGLKTWHRHVNELPENVKDPFVIPFIMSVFIGPFTFIL